MTTLSNLLAVLLVVILSSSVTHVVKGDTDPWNYKLPSSWMPKIPSWESKIPSSWKSKNPSWESKYHPSWESKNPSWESKYHPSWESKNPSWESKYHPSWESKNPSWESKYHPSWESKNPSWKSKYPPSWELIKTPKPYRRECRAGERKEGDYCNNWSCSNGKWIKDKKGCSPIKTTPKPIEKECRAGERKEADYCGRCKCSDGKWVCDMSRIGCGRECRHRDKIQLYCVTCSCFLGRWLCDNSKCPGITTEKPGPVQPIIEVCTEGYYDECNWCTCWGGCTKKGCGPRPEKPKVEVIRIPEVEMQCKDGDYRRFNSNWHRCHQCRCEGGRYKNCAPCDKMFAK